MRTFRVAVIGDTGRGGYGHGLDTAFHQLDGARIVAVADPDPAGRESTGRKLGTTALYADYREMLSREKPDIVCIGPRWVTDRVATVQAVAAAGCHIYCEKPLTGDLESADAILAACRKAGVKLAMAHQWRASAPVRQAIAGVRDGKYGRLLRVRVRPKDDSRGGGEELLVHGTHLFDMMIAMAGLPLWVSGHVTQAGREATRADSRQGTEPVGPIAGDSVSALFGFENGVRGYFESTAGLYRQGSPFGVLYGLSVECERALLHFCQPGDVYVYAAPTVMPDDETLTWKKQWIEDWHFTPEHLPYPAASWLHRGNQILARDLMDAIASHRDPLSSLPAAAFITEMVQGVYASHLAEGKRLSIPLKDRGHPLGS